MVPLLLYNAMYGVVVIPIARYVSPGDHADALDAADGAADILAVISVNVPSPLLVYNKKCVVPAPTDNGT